MEFSKEKGIELNLKVSIRDLECILIDNDIIFSNENINKFLNSLDLKSEVRSFLMDTLDYHATEFFTQQNKNVTLYSGYFKSWNMSIEEIKETLDEEYFPFDIYTCDEKVFFTVITNDELKVVEALSKKNGSRLNVKELHVSRDFELTEERIINQADQIIEFSINLLNRLNKQYWTDDIKSYTDQMNQFLHDHEIQITYELIKQFKKNEISSVLEALIYIHQQNQKGEKK